MASGRVPVVWLVGSFLVLLVCIFQGLQVLLLILTSNVIYSYKH